MNKSWKSFDLLAATPLITKQSSAHRKISPRSAPHSALKASRVIAQLKRSLCNPSSSSLITTSGGTSLAGTRLGKSCSRILQDDESKIEDASDEDEDIDQNSEAPNTPAENSCSPSITNCSAPSLDPKDVTICEQSRLDSDIEDVSDVSQSPPKVEEAQATEVPETSSEEDDSDCEAIHCKRQKRSALKFTDKSPGSCGRRLTDDVFFVANATARAATLEKSSTWIKSVVGETSPKGFRRTPARKLSAGWKRLDESFKDTTGIAGEAKSPPARKWKALNESFKESPPPQIESPDLTPEDSTLPKGNTVTIDSVPESRDSFYQPALNQHGTPRSKYRKNCPLSRLQLVLNEKISKQTFWLHEHQLGLIPPTNPVKIESISRIFGRVAISYFETDEDDPELRIEHTFYVDPGEKQLKTLRKGSLIEVEYDLEPHRLSRRQIVHLGVSKIKAVD